MRFLSDAPELFLQLTLSQPCLPSLHLEEEEEEEVKEEEQEEVKEEEQEAEEKGNVPAWPLSAAVKGKAPASKAPASKAKRGSNVKKEEKETGRCSHSGTVHYSWWNKHVANPIRESGYGGGGAAAMKLLRGTILEACMLRRTK